MTLIGDSSLHAQNDEVMIMTNAKTSFNAQLDEQHQQNNFKHIIAVASGKGGVGKSTVTVNLAVALAQQGFQVGVLDADVFGPSIPKMFQIENVQPDVEVIDGVDKIQPVLQYGVKILSMGLFIQPNDAVLWRGTLAGNALKQLISEANWGNLDFLIIDLPPGTSDIQITLAQTLNIDGAIIVCTPQNVAVADARRAACMFLHPNVNVPIIGLVENMSWFTPDELPDNKYFIFGKNGGAKLANELNVPLLGQIPITQDICDTSDSGLPVTLQKNHPTSHIFFNIADNILKYFN
jgi:ATP-binding protein involved in chromosome partitioning